MFGLNAGVTGRNTLWSELTKGSDRSLTVLSSHAHLERGYRETASVRGCRGRHHATIMSVPQQKLR